MLIVTPVILLACGESYIIDNHIGSSLSKPLITYDNVEHTHEGIRLDLTIYVRVVL